jgi:hypothetical protein
MSDPKVQSNNNLLHRVGHVVALPVVAIVGATAWLVRRLWSVVHPTAPTAPVNPRREEKQRRKSLWEKAA